ncbi:chorismate mutase [Mesonia hippocampi]|uniref:chorismate mutase n=1 Tax=Mesonia hippocampi TaxID=1628250 RepID=A0A840EPZ9_9FLAO|nr:bifunctional 3-deoxy-7-phosphoheptulonate synthase/chorismate mutase type II [Mesonia hippocampi]MBB4118673.1 chorismate mutase [Mesonia hippocampi]
MKNKKELNTWLNAFNLSRPLVIAGPCSAETEAQVLSTARALKNTDTSILRAGIWKPRTRPGNFEGVGIIGLEWLLKAKKETGLLTATEVANPTHVDLALKHEVDVLWLGARTTVSPFVVQEIAEALKGTDKIVLVKNPINPDLALWLGAVERLYKQNISKLGAIHRGFSTYQKITYRNNPEWQIPIDLQTEVPDLPLLLDPSHIAGNRSLIFDLCQTALDLNYDGFMIETHPNPDEAWSDAKQQITPSHLSEITKNLSIKREISNSKTFIDDLASLRAKIDVTDKQLIAILGERMGIVKEIGAIKNKKNVAILQAKRWNEISQKMIQLGKEKQLSEDFILQFFKAIHQESIRQQKEY